MSKLFYFAHLRKLHLRMIGSLQTKMMNVTDYDFREICNMYFLNLTINWSNWMYNGIIIKEIFFYKLSISKLKVCSCVPFKIYIIDKYLELVLQSLFALKTGFHWCKSIVFLSCLVCVISKLHLLIQIFSSAFRIEN